MGGLAESAAGVTNTYGNGDNQTTKHYYGGAQKGKKMACKKKKKVKGK